MLDSLGSTLTGGTIDSFFTRFGKNPHTDDLSVEEAIRCLETEVGRPESERQRVDGEISTGTGTGVGTSLSPSPAPGMGTGEDLRLGEMDFSGPLMDVDADFGTSKGGFVTEPAEVALLTPTSVPLPHARQGTSESSSDADADESSGSPSASATTGPLTPSSTTTPTTSSSGAAAAASSKKSRFRRPRYRKTQSSTLTAVSQVTSATTPTGVSVSSPPESTSSSSDESFERVINVKNCPLCHRPRLNDKAEVDIITHIAVCASQDWNKVDRIAVGNYVTASQAQRKWYTKIIGKISSGDYKLGAVSCLIAFFVDDLGS